MRKWKDDGSSAIKVKNRRLYLLIAYIGIVISSLNIFVLHNDNIFNIISLPMSLFLVYCVQFNGMYKIVRRITEYNLRRKDNKFGYRSWK